MNASAAPAKITRPTSSGVFLRHRLFRLLDHSRNQPILWITGPPGAGKTTLAASWITARRLPCLWYRVDEGDSDPASLFYYLGLAAKKATPRKRKSLPILTPEHLPGIRAFSRRFFETLYGRLGRANGNSDHRMELSAAIVFDNYQEVGEDSLFHEILYEGLRLAPPGIKIILVSRKDPPVAFVRLRANSLMKIIGWGELKFTMDESNRMVSRLGHKDASPDTLRQLHEKTDGWAAGIVLLLEGAENGDIESALSKVHASKRVYQYFAREIFDRLDPAARDFLLKTSLLPQMSANMAETLTGNRRAQSILSELNARNYFTQRLESDTALFEYHHLFRKFLQLLAREALNPGDLVDLKKKAAAILEESGQTQDAVELLLKAEDWPQTVRLILKTAPSLAGQGRGQTLENWIKCIPEAVVQNEPWLLYWAGVCRLSYSPPESHALFQQAFSLFRAERRDIVGIFLSLSGLFDSIFYSLGSFQPYDEAIALLEEVTGEFLSFPSFEIEARLTISKLYAIVSRQPWHPDLKKTAERALSILPMISDANMKMQLLHVLLSKHLFGGELQAAATLIDSFRGLVRTENSHPLFQTTLKVGESLYYSLTANFEDSRKAAEEGLEIAATTGIHIVDAYLLGYGAISAINTGDMEAADRFIRKMEISLHQEHFWGRQFYHFLNAWKLLIRGDILNSLSHAEVSLRFALEAGVPHTVAFGYFFCAIVLHKFKRDREAWNHLAEGHTIARSAGSSMVEFACLLAKAKFAFDSGDDSSGLLLLEKALSLGRDNGYVNTLFIWIPSMMAELCQRALEAGIEVDYVLYLIRKRNLMPDPPPVDCEKWPWALRIFTLGRFEIVRHGEPIEYAQFSGKVQKKPLEMLRALIAYGGGEVPKEQITDCLWPDARGDAVQSVFTTTLSRLRRLVGIEAAIRFQAGKVSLDSRYCWVDVSAFERILALFHKVIDAGPQSEFPPDVEAITHLIEKAVSLYRGHFLPGDDSLIWTISYREHLRNRFSRLISRTGEWLEKLGQWEKVIEYYQKGLDVDDLSEDFYQRLMICYRQLGRHANAIEVYRRCKKLFSLRLGIEPSARTKAIYEGITTFTST
jgi:DNA-binding SARP family transcriptional activator